MEKLIIQVHVNEAAKREKSPHVPYSPKEIAEQSIECCRAGASIVHYHARHPETGASSSDAELYFEVERRIKSECDMLTLPTLGAATLPTATERLAHIIKMAARPETKPDLIPIGMASSNLTQYHPAKREFVGDGDSLYKSTINTLRELCEGSRAVGVTPVAMLWNVASIRLTEAFLDMGLYSKPLLCELPLFADHMLAYGHPPTLKGLSSLCEFMPREWIWMASPVGANAFPVAAAAIAMGGHVTIGAADYPYPELGCPTNAQLVRYVVEIARYMGREIATPAETRQMLGLTRR
jgi:3-keto-5-aminohexanoate cleavage enzyme